MRRSSPQRERASAFTCPGWTQDACRVSSRDSLKPTPRTTCSSCSTAAPSHRSEEIVCPENVSFLGLPAYSPELDPVQRDGLKNSGGSCQTRPSRRLSYGKRRSAKRFYPTGRSLLAYGSSLVSPGGWRPSMRCDINNPDRYNGSLLGRDIRARIARNRLCGIPEICLNSSINPVLLRRNQVLFLNQQTTVRSFCAAY
jgi:hypothetical protein